MRLDKNKRLVYSELLGGVSDLTGGADAWVDWDLSAVVSAGAKYVEVSIYDDGTVPAGIRKNGSALDRKYTLTSWMIMTAELDSSKIIERWHPAGAAHSYYQVVGEWR